jgi:hypothetical protein
MTARPAGQRGPAVRASLTRDAGELADFYAGLAAEVGKPGAAGSGQSPAVPPIGAPDRPDGSDQLCVTGAAHYHPESLWVRDHLSHLGSHSAALIGPAARLAALRRRPWWR